ncbi:Olfactory receptor 2A1/2A42 [Fukomys damarensis]|uniref:Olfactory receptor 2A1/2A42 n=2 Tax=Fukomys damarensis TaxID=885580 RepID=A0A091D7U5_FUKDA|nr:Olfactory receptor 2A1/2A42 [Fukomys damarensis]
MLVNLLNPDKPISFAGCMTQTFLFLTFAITECLLLVVMSYDHYVVICHPLRYSAIMSWSVCITLAVTSWTTGFLLSLIHLMLLLPLPFCMSKKVNHFCEIMAVLKLACADTHINENMVLAGAVSVLLGPFSMIVVSYLCILCAIMKIQSGKGKRKAFSTCSSHLCVVGLFYGTAIITEMEENQTVVTEFVLLGFCLSPRIHIVILGVFSFFYAFTLLGNGLILGLICLDSRLHTPMYFFLSQLAIVDIAYACNTVPQMLVNLLNPAKPISFAGCMTQTFLFLTFAHIECLLLVVMSYDRYVAICHPLQYCTIMGWRVCNTMVITSWACGSLLALVHTSLILRLPFCGPNQINHFFCEILSVLKLACADTWLNKVVIFAASVFVLVGPLCLVLVSYSHILVAILRIQSGEGRRKAFSTCSSHLCVVGLFFGSAIVMYMAPKSQHSEEQQKILFLFYSFFNPMLNPLIYSLRNAEVKRALRRALCTDSHSQVE